MRRFLILLPIALVVAAGGIAIGRYVVPVQHGTAATDVVKATTTTTTSPPGPVPGIYDIQGSGPGGVGLFLVVQLVKPGTAMEAGGAIVSVSFRGQDGSISSVDQLTGTAAFGVLTLQSESNPGEGTFQGSRDGSVSGSYGTSYPSHAALLHHQGAPSIFFGGGQCATWGGPEAIQACSFERSNRSP